MLTENDSRSTRYVKVGALLFALVACASSVADSPPIPEKLPIQAFGQTPFIARPQLSPSGDRIAAEVDVRGKAMLAIVHLFEKGRAPTVVTTGEHELRWFQWAGDDRLLISMWMAMKWEGVELYATRLLVYEVSTGKAMYLGKKREGLVGDDVLFVSADGTHILLAVSRDVWSYPAIYRVELASGEMTKVLAAKTPIVDWYADSKGVVRIGFGYVNRKMKIVYRESEADKFKTVAKVSLEDLEGDIDTVKFRTSGDKGFVFSNAKTGRFALYEFDWKTFEFGKPIFEHPSVDLDDFRLSPDGNEIEAVFYTDDRPRVAWLEPNLKALQAEIDESLPGRMNWVTSTNRDRSRLLVWSGTADDPGHYFFYDRASQRMDRVATPYDMLLDKQLAPVKAVSYRARDGLEIPAYLTLPVGRAPRNLPLILLPHGGPHLRDTWGYSSWVQYLANRGYAVLQPNFRGSSGYGTEFLAKGFGQWGTGMQDDLTDGVLWLTKEGTIDPKRVCIMGASYGGYAAIMGTIRTPELFRCAISFAGVTDVNEMMRYDRSRMLPARYKNWRQRVIGEQEVDLGTVSPVNRAAEVAVPLLLIHGTADSNVPYRQAEKFVQAMKAAGKPLEFLELKGVGHGLGTESDRTRFLTTLDAFLTKHNPAD